MDNKKKHTFRGRMEVLSVLTENIPDFLVWHLIYPAIKLAGSSLKNSLWRKVLVSRKLINISFLTHLNCLYCY